jgi:hypothetical protein
MSILITPAHSDDNNINNINNGYYQYYYHVGCSSWGITAVNVMRKE